MVELIRKGLKSTPIKKEQSKTPQKESTIKMNKLIVKLPKKHSPGKSKRSSKKNSVYKIPKDNTA